MVVTFVIRTIAVPVVGECNRAMEYTTAGVTNGDPVDDENAAFL
jgi:hypothetical protein